VRGAGVNQQVLQIEVRNGADVVEVSLIGDVDMATEEQVVDALSPFAGRAVIVDLSRVGFIDSSGMRALVLGKRASDAAGGSVALRAPSSEATRVLDISGVSAFIETID
jgi:anti-sigma B factor antagonist